MECNSAPRLFRIVLTLSLSSMSSLYMRFFVRWCTTFRALPFKTQKNLDTDYKWVIWYLFSKDGKRVGSMPKWFSNSCTAIMEWLVRSIGSSVFLEQEVLTAFRRFQNAARWSLLMTMKWIKEINCLIQNTAMWLNRLQYIIRQADWLKRQPCRIIIFRNKHRWNGMRIFPFPSQYFPSIIMLRRIRKSMSHAAFHAQLANSLGLVILLGSN